MSLQYSQRNIYNCSNNQKIALPSTLSNSSLPVSGKKKQYSIVYSLLYVWAYWLINWQYILHTNWYRINHGWYCLRRQQGRVEYKGQMTRTNGCGLGFVTIMGDFRISVYQQSRHHSRVTHMSCHINSAVVDRNMKLATPLVKYYFFPPPNSPPKKPPKIPPPALPADDAADLPVIRFLKQ